jgi:hypothetical protein
MSVQDVYAVGSAFESCPAATGAGDPACTGYPDGAHRCGRHRDHREAVNAFDWYFHACLCGINWTSAVKGGGHGSL